MNKKNSAENFSEAETMLPEAWGPNDFEDHRRVALLPKPEEPNQQIEWVRQRMDIVWAFRYGYGTEPNERRYFELIKHLAEIEVADSEAGAKWHLALAYKEGIGTATDANAYVEWMRRAAEDGDQEAMFNLADAYEKGIGVAHDEAEYFHWTRKMAETDYPIALLNLAVAYRDGIGTSQDDDQFFANAERAMELAKAALNSGAEDTQSADFSSEDLPKAFQLVAEAYRDGRGRKQSSEQNFTHLQLAANAVDKAIERQELDDASQVDDLRKALAPIWIELADAYQNRVGTSASDTEAFALISKAAEAGHPPAMLRMADSYEEGRGVAKDAVRCFEWLKKTAEARSLDDIYQTSIAEGMYRTSITYGTGTGVDSDAGKFYRWTRQAVGRGQEKAFMAMGPSTLAQDGLLQPSELGEVLKCFHNLRDDVLRVKSLHKLDLTKADQDVAHFTTLDALYNMLPRRDHDAGDGESANVLWLFNIAYLNDPQEGQSLIFRDAPYTKLLREFFPSANDEQHRDGGNPEIYDPLPLLGLAFSVYIGSFTLRADRLDLWRAYGKDGDGFCIVTPVDHFLEERVVVQEHGFAGLAGIDQLAPNVSTQLYHVHYEQRQVVETCRILAPSLRAIQKMRELLCSSHPDKNQKGEIRNQVNMTTRAILSDILFLYKHSEYSSEDEVRMLAPYPISAPAVCVHGTAPGRLYVMTREFLFQRGARIIIGPKVSDPVAVRLELKHMLDRNGHADVEVDFSEIPYR